MDDYINRSAALACIEGYQEKDGSIVSPDELPEYQRIERLPAADVIPLSWINKQIEQLKSMDNAFLDLTAMQISAMVEKWRAEQNGERRCG